MGKRVVKLLTLWVVVPLLVGLFGFYVVGPRFQPRAPLVRFEDSEHRKEPESSVEDGPRIGRDEAAEPLGREPLVQVETRRKTPSRPAAPPAADGNPVREARERTPTPPPEPDREQETPPEPDVIEPEAPPPPPPDEAGAGGLETPPPPPERQGGGPEAPPQTKGP